MMPLCLERLDGSGHRVPITGDPFTIGRAHDNDLVIEDTRVAPHHARLRYQRGTWVLVPTRGEHVAVNGQSHPVMPLTHGDEIQLSYPGQRDAVAVRLHDGYRDAFVPPDASWTEAWLNLPGSASEEAQPEALGTPAALGTRPIDRSWKVPAHAGKRTCVVKRLRRLVDPREGDRYLRLLTALAGAYHPHVARTVGGGVYRNAKGEAWLWHAAEYAPGLDLKATLAAGGYEPAEAVGLCASIGTGLAHLHARGVVHRDVSPGNIVIGPQRDGVLIDLGSAFLAEHGAPASEGVRGTPGYLAPEEVQEGGGAIGTASDVYGLCAVVYGLLTGRPPAAGEDVLETLVDSRKPPIAPSDLGIQLEPSFESLLVAGLSPDPDRRPSATQLADAASSKPPTTDPDPIDYAADDPRSDDAEPEPQTQ